MMASHTLGQLAQILGCSPPVAGADSIIFGLATLEDATAGELAMLGSDAYIKYFASTRAGAVVVGRNVKVPPSSTPILLVDNADLAMARLLAVYAPPTPRPPAGVDGQARVDASSVLGEGVAVGFAAVIGPRCHIGSATVIHPGVFIGADVAIGRDCELFPGVVIRHRVTIGDRVTIHAGAVLGSDGFGYRWDGTAHAKIPQIGVIIVEDDVEIGSCTCIDRAKVGATRIGRGTKIDNLVQIAHNVTIGPHCIIAGQTGIAGSTTLGAGVVIGGQSALRDHIAIGDGAMIAARSAVAADIPAKTIVSGMPALPHRQTLREQGELRKLPELRAQVKAMQKQIEKLLGPDQSNT